MNESNDVDVIPRDALDDEHRDLHPKPWLVQYPCGYIVYHDTEDEACAHQVAHRTTMELEKIYVDISESP